MLNVQKTIQMTSLLFGMTILFCYIGWHLGYDGLILVGEVDLPWYVTYCICKILVFINLTLVGSFVMQNYKKRVFFYIIPIVLLTGIFDILNLETLGSGPLPIVYFLLIAAIPDRKKTKGAIVRSIIVTVVTLSYQLLAIVFKTGKLTLNYELPMFTVLMFSIDMILLLLLVWSIGGVYHGKRKLEFLVFPGRIRNEQFRNESSEGDSQGAIDVPVNSFERWVIWAVVGVVQVLQWIVILWVCNQDKYYLDALVITTSFICHGMIISNRKHFKPIILCTFAATILFYFAARFTIPFKYSQFFSIVIGLILVYTIYRISYQFEKAAQDKLDEELTRVYKLEKEMEKAWDQIDRLS